MAHIRNAHEGEADLLTAIGLRAWHHAMTAIGEADSQLGVAHDAFFRFISKSWITITVIEQNGAAAGWAAREALDENITDFWIDPAQTRGGLGSALLQAVEDEMRRQGLDKAALETHAQNEGAISFFEKHGYAINWLSLAYSPKLDRDMQSVGLSKALFLGGDGIYGPGGTVDAF